VISETCQACGKDYLAREGIRNADRSRSYCSAYCLRQAEQKQNESTKDAEPKPAEKPTEPTSLKPWLVGCLLVGALLSLMVWNAQSTAKKVEAKKAATERAMQVEAEGWDRPPPTQSLPESHAPEPSEPDTTESESTAPDALSLLNQAQSLQNTDPEAAARHLEQALALEPSVMGYAMQTDLNLQKQAYEPALSSAQKCLDLADTNDEQILCHQRFLTIYAAQSQSSPSDTEARTQNAANRTGADMANQQVKHLDAMLSLQPEETSLIWQKAQLLCGTTLNQPAEANQLLQASCEQGSSEFCQQSCLQGQIGTVDKPESEASPDAT